MVDRLDIKIEMRVLDRKDRQFYDNLTEEEQRRLSLFPMIRWLSDVQGSRELQEYYVIATNERMNRHFFSINATRHKRLQWLMATSVSPGLGTHTHSWIPGYKRDKAQSSKRRALSKLRPELEDAELDVLVQITTDREIRDYQRSLGEDV